AGEVERLVAELRGDCPLPIGVGFGISTPAEAAAVAAYADAVVVGSAIVRLIEAGAGSPALVAEVGDLLRALKTATRRVAAAAAVASPIGVAYRKTSRAGCPRGGALDLHTADGRLPAYARLALRPRGGQGDGLQARTGRPGAGAIGGSPARLSDAARRRHQRQ